MEDGGVARLVVEWVGGQDDSHLADEIARGEEKVESGAGRVLQEGLSP